MSGSRDHQDASPCDVEVIDVDGQCLNVIKPAAIFTTNGTIFELPEEIIRPVDDFEVPKGFQRSGCREQSFMYSLGVYVKPVDPNDGGHKFFCMVSSSCRTKKTVIPCKNGDRSNVKSHHKKHHKPRGAQGAKKAENQKSRMGNIHRSFEASKNSNVGMTR